MRKYYVASRRSVLLLFMRTLGTSDNTIQLQSFLVTPRIDGSKRFCLIDLLLSRTALLKN